MKNGWPSGKKSATFLVVEGSARYPFILRKYGISVPSLVSAAS